MVQHRLTGNSMRNACSKGQASRARERNPEDCGVTKEGPRTLVRSRTLAATALAGLGCIAAAMPLLSPLALAAGGALGWARWQHLRSRPLKMPWGSGKDPNEWHPGPKLQDAKGIAFLGHDESHREIWLTEADIRQHMLVLGETGAHKSSFLMGLAANALTWGSGLMYVDGKGSVSTYTEMFALCRHFGREKDLIVLNFLSEPNTGSNFRLSMRMNPFRNGSSCGLTQLMVSLLDDFGDDVARTKLAACGMMGGIMQALCWLRDNKGLTLDASTIMANIGLKAVMNLAQDESIPHEFRTMLNSYLMSIPGFRADRGYNQNQATLDQHAYLQVVFAKTLGSISEVYSHIFTADGVDMDIYDVVLNRRILLVLIPSMEKASGEIALLGKIVLTTLKGMMGATLGSKLEGNWEDVVMNRPTNSTSPFLCILDDVGYYTVDGMALMAAQARTLGFSMCYASHDVNAMKRINEKEAQSIISNTDMKIFMNSGGFDKIPEFAGAPKLKKAFSIVMRGNKRVDTELFHPGNVPRDTKQCVRLVPLVVPIWDSPGKTDITENKTTGTL